MRFHGLHGMIKTPWKMSAVLRVAILAGLSSVLVGATPAVSFANAKFAALTVDARNGKILYAENIDAIRHPASLTKMMTLYLLFQDMSSGKMSLNSPITVSARCTGMAPSKLGVRAGQSISAETATRALVVKSANDIACAVAETLGGSEKAFAQRMTSTARSLGMSRTTFLNASGLPNPGQVTSARDMATLGLRLMRDYPQYYPYFRTRSFVYQGKTINGHNRLLGSYEGTDGIKTGYVAASGFNLVSSVRRGDKRLVGVVLGGTSGASRDAYMKKMLSAHFDEATNGRTIVAYAGSSKGAKPAEEAAEQTEVASTDAAETTAKPASRKETAAKRLPARKTKAQEDQVAASTGEEPAEQGDTEDGVDSMANLAAQAAAPTQGTAATAAAATTGTTTKAEEPAAQVETVPQPMTGETVAAEQQAVPFQQKTQEQQLADQAQMASIAAGTDAGWTITLGEYATKTDAAAVLQYTRKRTPDAVNGREAQTVMVERKGKVTYRARFTGFDEASAASACKAIKKTKVPCQAQGPS